MADEERDKARPLAGISASSVLQCFDTVGWITGGTCGPLKTCASSHKGSLMAQVKEENWRGTS